MNVIQEIRRINERELAQGVSGKASWHHEYKDSAWVFAGGFPYDLTEGDILCVMSQWGEIEDINLCREQDTGKSKGFCFLKYEDQKSTILAVDNFNGIELLGRTIRVDHKHKYSLPAEVRERAEKEEEEKLARGEVSSTKGAQWRPGVVYEGKELATAHNFHKGVDVFAAPGKGSASSDDSDDLEGSGGGVTGESAAAKQQRRQEKRLRKEARSEARERKKHRSSKKRDGESGDDRHKKKKKHNKEKDRRDESIGESRGDDRKVTQKGGSGEIHDWGDSTGRYGRKGEETRGGADAAGAWERGVRTPGGSAPFAPPQAPGRAAEPAPLSTGSVMDWRGLGGRGTNGRRGGRGGRGGGRGGGGEGRGRGRDSGRGGRGGEGMNSLGGMGRRR